MVVTPCQEFQGSRDKDGYGRRGKERKRVHVWVWEQVNGPVPEGMCVLHICDNPPCFRYDHLWIGTPADNNRDRASKGRSARFPHRAAIDQSGERNNAAKLTDADIVAIRAALDEARPWDGTQTRLAQQYGVSKSLITLIKRGWRT